MEPSRNLLQSLHKYKDVIGLAPVELSIVRKQLIAILEDLSPSACKIGMLFSKEIIIAVTDILQRYRISNIVVDPVMIATSGDLLIKKNTIPLLFEKLFPLAVLITPNHNEAEKLSQIKIKTFEDAITSAKIIYKQM